MQKIVIALGGNALGNDPDEQKKLVQLPAKKIVSLVKEGNKVIVGHGNGPQVGMIFNAFSDAKKQNDKTPLLSFSDAGSMSQGYIGIHLSNAISNELKKQKLSNEVLYLLTQTIVDKDDVAFKNPSKPVGPFYKTLREAEINNSNSIIIEDSGRGFRKIVPSPKPIDFIGLKTFNSIINNESSIIILGGGGGIPTILKDDNYCPIDGVIDKDFSLSLIADKVGADLFIILTAVDFIYINFNKENQTALKEVKIKDLKKYIIEGQFAKGSMLPKVEAAISFIEKNKNKIAIIANLDKIEEAIIGKSGTKIIY
ncbi:MAG: carbamate kinase [Metamycoplasmataceae bacterium]